MQSQFTTSIAGTYCNFHPSIFMGEKVYHLSVLDEGSLRVYFVRNVEGKWQIPDCTLTKGVKQRLQQIHDMLSQMN